MAKKKTTKKSTQSKKVQQHKLSVRQRVTLIVAYSAFAAVFVLFGQDSGAWWQFAVAVLCVGMVLRHVIGILRSYGKK